MIGVLIAPALVDLYSTSKTSPAERALAIEFSRYFLPQIAFYGVGATMGAILNTRRRFAAPMWAPVLNNLVVLATGVVVLLMPDAMGKGHHSCSHTQVVVLALGHDARRRRPRPSRWCPRCGAPGSAGGRDSTSATPAWPRPAASAAGSCSTCSPTSSACLVVVDLADRTLTGVERARVGQLRHLRQRLRDLLAAARHRHRVGDHRPAAPDEPARRRRTARPAAARDVDRAAAVLGRSWSRRRSR